MQRDPHDSFNGHRLIKAVLPGIAAVSFGDRLTGPSLDENEQRNLPVAETCSFKTDENHPILV